MTKIKKLVFISLLLILSLIALTANAATWQLLTTGTTNDINDIFFVNATTGWAVGASNMVLKTANGTTWVAQTTPGPPRILQGVHFIDANTGWAVGNSGKIIKTTNGGTTWVNLTSPISKNLQSVFFVNATTGYIVGDAGTILKTTDGGTTWTSQTSPSANNHLGALFIDTNTGWIVGNTGTILKTTDGGATWVTQTSGTLKHLNDVYFLDANTGWIVGNSGTLLKTTNGGTTWTALNSGTNDSIQGVYFVDANNGWVTGDNGMIRKTTDGGTTWTADTSGLNIDFKSINFVDINNGWVAGANGKILRAPYVTVSLTANPNSGTAPLTGVDLTATVDGNAIGNIVYQFDCTNDGSFEYTSAATPNTTYTATDVCNYASQGTYTAKVLVTRDGLTATATTTINVSAPPTLTISLVANPNTGTNPLENVDLIAQVSGTATGNIIYKFDCENDGTFEHTSAATTQTTYTAAAVCTYPHPGNYTANAVVERQGLTANSTAGIIVIERMLLVSLSANPDVGVAPLTGVGLNALVTGNAIGDIIYKFDCENDGTLELTSASTTENTFTATDLCNYPAAGNYTAKTIVERQGLTAENTAAITVITPEDALAVSLIANPNSGVAPLTGVTLEATVSGMATGNIIYKFDCENDGIFEHESGPTLTNPYSASKFCNYPNPGTYTAKAEVLRALTPEEGAQIITQTATAEIYVSPPPLIIVTEALLPNGAINQFYSITISAAGGWGTKAFDLLTGKLPNGLTLSPNGAISGAPTEDGTFYFQIAVSDEQPVITKKNFTLFIAPLAAPGVPQTNIVIAEKVEASAGGGVKLINENQTEIVVAIEGNAVSGVASYSIVVNNLNSQSSNFVLVPETIGKAVANLNYQIEVINDATAQKITTFEKPITIKISYLDSDLPSGFDESKLKIYFYNEATSSWEPLDTIVDTVNNIATAQVSHLTRFALVAAAAPIVAPPSISLGRALAPIPRKVGAEKVDFNEDGRVNLVDFSILAYWYKKRNPPSHLDVNGDGKIDLVEFSTLIYYWTR